METFAIDYETSYEKGRDIKSLGTGAYLRHPATDIYLVSIVGQTWNYVGDPRLAPWDAISGPGKRWVAHNRSFDAQVQLEAIKRGIIPADALPEEWHCTADLAAFLQSPRSLDKAAAMLLQVRLSKAVRKDMKGKKWPELNQEQRKIVCDYAINDSVACYGIWKFYQDQWPEFERRLSVHTSVMGMRGIGVDEEKVQQAIDHLKDRLWRVGKTIPWWQETDAKGKEVKPTSLKRLVQECEKHNIPTPPTTDTKDERFEEWAEDWEERAPFVGAVQQFRKINRLLKVCEGMKARTYEGRVQYGSRYYGTHTGRWAGDSGLNMQNLAKKPYEGVDSRGLLIPRPGHKFLCADLAQIEARVLLWYAGDEKMLEMIRGGMELYEAHARTSGYYQDPRPLKEVDNDLRQFAKCQRLGLGFGLGPGKYQRIVKQWTGKDISATEAERQVAQFRSTNPKIVQFWTYLNQLAKNARASDPNRYLEIELPSGRMQRYFGLQGGEGGMRAQTERGGVPTKIYGGKMTENVDQALSRDIHAVKVLDAEDRIGPVVLHTHDEILVEVPEADAQDAAHELEELMKETPDFVEGLPIASDVKIMDRYGK